MPPPTPKFVERIDTFASSLVRFGVPSSGAYYQAHGIVHMLLRYCERRHTDWLGNARDVDKAILWTTPPQVIAPAMEKAGLLVCKNYEFVFPYAWELCSHAAKRRWMEVNRDSYMQAKARRVPVDNPMPLAELVMEPDRDLFGDVLHGDTEKAKAVETGHKTIVAYWFSRWEEKYGTKCTFRKRDGSCIKQLLSERSADEIKSAIDAYLSCSEKFYEGHELSWLYSKINRWVAASKPRSPAHGIDYERRDEPLPTVEL